MSILNSIELIKYWRLKIRQNCADSIRARRRYAKMYGENSALVNYFEGKESAYREGIRILEYMVEYQEMFDGDRG